MKMFKLSNTSSFLKTLINPEYNEAVCTLINLIYLRYILGILGIILSK